MGRGTKAAVFAIAAAAAAAAARSCAFFFGADFFGCSRIGGMGASPALPRNFATRSVASAPWPSQCLMRSSCKRTRSVCSAGSIGL